MPGSVRDLPPRGHYLAGEAGRLAGVSGHTLGQWARRGYVRSSQSTGVPRVYAYQDVVEAMIVHELLERGVPHAEILRSVQELHRQLGTDWPLSRSELAVTLVRPDVGRQRPGRGPASWLLAKQGERYIRPSKADDQFVLAIDVVQVDRDLERGGWIARDLADLRHIEVNPDRLSGRPTIRGRRIAAEEVARTALEEADGWATLRDGYDLTDEQIRDAVRWWQRVQEYEAAA